MARRRTHSDPSQAVGYVRVSTEDQHLGPEAQRAAVERWAAANGVSVVAWHEDHVSGAAELEKRPGLLAALDSVTEHGAGLLLVAKRDRLARDVVLAAMVERLLARSGAAVASADGNGNGAGDDPSALLMRRMVDAFAEYERALIRGRTRAALAVKRSRGERVGAEPIGTRVSADGVHLEAHGSEAEAVARIRELRAGGRSLRAIATTLNTEAVPARGSRWHPTTVARVLNRCSATGRTHTVRSVHTEAASAG